ncbi:MAG: PilN domain-containing protein [Chloroflexota bacterium]
MAKQIVTLYIDDSSLRLMVSHGKQIREWAEWTLEPELVKGNVVLNEAEVAAKIRQLFAACKVRTTKVAVGISGLHCFSRPISFPQLPRDMLAEAVQREAKRVLPVPLEQLYLSWQSIPAPQGKTQVFLVAVPRKTIDALLGALRLSGLKPYFMDVKPLLLARVARDKTAVIVDVQMTEFDIIVMANGIPQPIRSVPFATQTPTSEEKLTAIKNELSRTITFYNTTNPENVLAPTVPIFVSGELASEPEMCQALSEAIGHPVLMLSSPLESRGEFTPSRYMVNIGLALQSLSGKEVGPSVVNLNVLPHSYLPKPISLLNIGAFTGIGVTAGLVALMIFFNQGVSADIASARAELKTTEDLLKQQQSERQQLLNKITELEDKVKQSETSLYNITAAFNALEKQSAGISRELDVAMNELPYSVNLTGVSHADNKLTMSGQVPSEKEILAYLKSLGLSGIFGEITLTKMDRTQGKLDFALLGDLEKPGSVVSSGEVILRGLSDNTTLTKISYASETLTIQGVAPGEEDVRGYLSTLDKSGRFAGINISMAKLENETISFSLSLTIKKVT